MTSLTETIKSLNAQLITKDNQLAAKDNQLANLMTLLGSKPSDNVIRPVPKEDDPYAPQRHQLMAPCSPPASVRDSPPEVQANADNVD